MIDYHSPPPENDTCIFSHPKESSFSFYLELSLAFRVTLALPETPPFLFSKRIATSVTGLWSRTYLVSVSTEALEVKIDTSAGILLIILYMSETGTETSPFTLMMRWRPTFSVREPGIPSTVPSRLSPKLVRQLRLLRAGGRAGRSAAAQTPPKGAPSSSSA